MFAVIRRVVGALGRGYSGYSGFAVDPYVEVGDHFAVGLVVPLSFMSARIDCLVSQFLQLDPLLKLSAQFFSTKDESPAVSAFTESFSISVIVATAFLSVVVAAFLPKAVR
jgi:hypothetical protein